MAHIVTWHIITVVLYGLAVPMTVYFFPDVSNLWLSVLVLMTGFTSGVAALAAALAAAEGGG